MKKIFTVVSVILSLLIFTACNDTTTTTTTTKNKNAIDLAMFEELKEWRLSSYSSGTEVSTEHYLRQRAPYDDNYEFETNANTTIRIYDTTGKRLLYLEPESTSSLYFNKDEVIYMVLEGTEGTTIGYEVELEARDLCGICVFSDLCLLAGV